MGRQAVWYQRAAGAVLALGLTGLVALVGIVGAVAFGPDDTFYGRASSLSTSGVALVTSPEAIGWVGPTYHLRTLSETGAPALFLGVAHESDLKAYLGDAQHSVITDLGLPWGTPVVAGSGSGSGPVPPPGGLDLWEPVTTQGDTDAAPAATAEIEWPSRDGAWQVVVMRADGAGPVAASLQWEVELPYAFKVSLGLVVAGAALLALVIAVLLRRRHRRRRSRALRSGGSRSTGSGTGSLVGSRAGPQADAPPSPLGERASRRAARDAATARVSRLRAGALLGGAAAASVLILVTVTLVAPVSRNDAGATSSLAPVISDDRADAVLQSYLATVRIANSRREAQTLREVETGAVLRTDEAAQTISRFQDPSVSTLKSFTVVEPEVWIPRGSSYPRAFLATGAVQEQDAEGTSVGEPSRDHSVMVFQQDSPTGQWLQNFSVRAMPDVTESLPEPVDDASALVSPPPPQVGTVMSSWVEQLSGVDPRTSDTGRAIQGDAYLDASRASAAEFFKQVSATHTVHETARPGPDAPVALRTKDGGMLLFFSTELVRTATPQDPQAKRTWITVNDDVEALLGRPTARTLTITWTQQWLAVLPPSGQGEARIVGQLSWPTAAHDEG